MDDLQPSARPLHIVEALSRSNLGGGQALLFFLVEMMGRIHDGIRFTIILPKGGSYVERFRSLKVEVIEFPLDRLSPLHLLRFASLLSKLNPDTVHSHGKGAGLYTRSLPRSTLRARRIHTHHGFHPPKGRVRRFLYRSIESSLLDHVDILVAVSKSEADELRGCFPALVGRMKVIQNVVNLEEIRERSKAPLIPEVEGFLSRNSHNLIVSMVARRDPVKNHRLAFDACRLLLERGGNIAFIFAGVDADDPDIQNLRNISSGSVFASASLQDAVPIMGRSDIVLLTSEKEGCPLVVLEAFCLAKPVIGTNVGGIRDLVLHEYNGILCDQDAPSLVHSIHRLATDRVLYQRLSENALRTSLAMDSKAWVDEYFKLYSSNLS